MARRLGQIPIRRGSVDRVKRLAGTRRWNRFRAPVRAEHAPDKPTRDDIVGIQALRWFAASLVVWVHSEHELVKVAARRHHALRFSRLIEFGTGVDIFFLISGFLIFLVSRDLFGRQGAGRGFLVRRVVRIIPLYWLATASMLLATLAVPSLLNHGVPRPIEVAASFLMVAWPDPAGGMFPLLASGWTLNLEFYFYVLFALVLRFRASRGVPILFGVLAATVATDQLWRASPPWLDFYAQPIVLEFGAGILLCLAWRRGVRIAPATAAAMAVLAIALHLGLRALGHPPRILGNGLPAGLLFVAAVFGARVRLPRPAAGVIRLMGDASYALYLTSPFAINTAVEILTRCGVHDTTVLLIGAYAASLLAALAVHVAVERPLTRACRGALGRGRPIVFRPGRARRDAVVT